jgi:hypothetical protein
MSHFAWVMFWKAVVVALWVAGLETWRASKARHREKGMELRQNRRGTYVPYDPYERAEWWAKRGAIAFAAVFIPYTLYVVYVLFSEAGVI